MKYARRSEGELNKKRGVEEGKRRIKERGLRTLSSVRERILPDMEERRWNRER